MDEEFDAGLGRFCFLAVMGKRAAASLLDSLRMYFVGALESGYARIRQVIQRSSAVWEPVFL